MCWDFQLKVVPARISHDVYSADLETSPTVVGFISWLVNRGGTSYTDRQRFAALLDLSTRFGRLSTIAKFFVGLALSSVLSCVSAQLVVAHAIT
jgi:hypothetical protein